MKSVEFHSKEICPAYRSYGPIFVGDVSQNEIGFTIKIVLVQVWSKDSMAFSGVKSF